MPTLLDEPPRRTRAPWADDADDADGGDGADPRRAGHPPPGGPADGDDGGGGDDHGDAGRFRWVTVATFWKPTDAHLARIHLENEGIDVVILDETLVATDWFMANAIGGIKLQVPEPDSIVARSLLTTRRGRGRGAGTGLGRGRRRRRRSRRRRRRWRRGS
jgi:hypothetical protein